MTAEFPSMCPNKRGAKAPCAGLMACYSWSLFTKHLFWTWNVYSDGQRGLSQSCLWKKLAKEPQGAPSIEPSKHLFIKANVSSPLGT